MGHKAKNTSRHQEMTNLRNRITAIEKARRVSAKERKLADRFVEDSIGHTNVRIDETRANATQLADQVTEHRFSLDDLWAQFERSQLPFWKRWWLNWRDRREAIATLRAEKAERRRLTEFDGVKNAIADAVETAGPAEPASGMHPVSAEFVEDVKKAVLENLADAEPPAPLNRSEDDQVVGADDGACLECHGSGSVEAPWDPEVSVSCNECQGTGLALDGSGEEEDANGGQEHTTDVRRDDEIAPAAV